MSAKKLVTFHKLHVAGNDFMLIDNRDQLFQPQSNQIQAWAKRYTGIGFDQLLLIEPARTTDTDFFYRIFNANGLEVGQCGNGACCLGWFLQKQINKNLIRVSTLSTVLELHRQHDQIKVNLGKPEIQSEQLSLRTESEHAVSCTLLSLGNPHCVVQVEDVAQAPVSSLGAQLSLHHHFPHHTNVEFMQFLNKKNIALRVYERGVGETQACGSGACAAVVAGCVLELLDDEAIVHFHGGTVQVQWKGCGHPVFLTAKAHWVFTGEIKT